MTTFRNATPCFHVADYGRAIKFWTETMGFKVSFTNGEPTSFTILERDDVAIHVSVGVTAAGTGHCHFSVNGVDDFHSKCKAAGVDIRQAPKDQMWGLRDIVIADPDGNTMECAERVK